MELPRRRTLPKKSFVSVHLFLAVMLIVIAVQGTYLGYTVGILTNLERRFNISSRKSGTLLSIYDVGHTVSVILVGILANGRNIPRITAVGVLVSALSMFLLTLPVVIFGTISVDQDSLTNNRVRYIAENRCDSYRDSSDMEEHCARQKEEQVVAFHILGTGQFLAGVAAAPFNTIAYVYIDDNLKNKAISPFYLGLLSSMYAFAPALGFLLSAGLTRIHTTLFNAPADLDMNNDEWVGAWWLGFIICGVLYTLCAIPLFFFPASLLHPENEKNNVEMMHLRHEQLHHQDHEIATDHDHRSHELAEQSNRPIKISVMRQLKEAAEDFPLLAWELMKNPVFMTMVIGWMFGSYLAGGYSTYLPKYIETQYARSASTANIYAGLISIGSIAVSTALGGYILTHFNLSPRNAILCLIASWSIIVVSYLSGLIFGCDEPVIEGLFLDRSTSRLRFMEFVGPTGSSCDAECRCEYIYHFNPVNHNGVNYFSPCHAGCLEFSDQIGKWNACRCADMGHVESGLFSTDCNQMFAYVAVMFIGLFLGNLFFMTTMMVILRCVYDYQKIMALSFASCATNILGFIPAPIVFGLIIDGACILWHSQCPQNPGNCVIYNNSKFRQNFHLSNALLQFFAVIAIIFCYLFSRKRILPEEEDKHDEQLSLSDDYPITYVPQQTDL